MLDCFLDYSVNPNLRFHSRIDKIIDDVIREKINIPHKFRMRLESRHCVESRIIYFRFRVLDKACLQCNVFLKGLSEEMKEALSDERIDFAVIYEGIQGSQQDTDTDDKRNIVLQYFFIGDTDTYIGKMLDCSRANVTKCRIQALDKLKQLIEEEKEKCQKS